eukprot:14099341-Alexandrium_andersonii.AAC.1
MLPKRRLKLPEAALWLASGILVVCFWRVGAARGSPAKPRLGLAACLCCQLMATREEPCLSSVSKPGDWAREGGIGR